jgi:transcriptional regulator with XRE-family HTH domain
MGTDSETVKTEKLMVLGNRIRSLRNAQGMSQVQLADRAGMSPRYLSEVEAGKRNVSFACLDTLAKQLSITLAELLNFEEPHARTTVLQQVNSMLEGMPLDNLLFVRRALRLLQK